jgi:hypothetical protein
MRFQVIIAAMMVVAVIVEARRTLPRKVFSLRGHLRATSKSIMGTSFVQEDDVSLYQSERRRPFIPTEDFVEECIRCLNNLNGLVNVWWSPLYTIEKMEMTVQPDTEGSPKTKPPAHDWTLCV